MKTTILLFTLLIIEIFAAETETQYYYYHGEYPSTPYSATIGGIDLPASGTIKVLFIFCQFPDDNYDTTNSAWPKRGVPINYNTWVDETWSSNATPYSMTDYFNQMSLNTLHFIGKKVSVETPHSRNWYLQNKKTRGFIHHEIINQLDATWDFAEFDNWKKISNYNHQNVADTKIDWVCFVWRNIAMEYPENKVLPTDTTRSEMMDSLDMGWESSTVLGSVNVDGGARTITNAGATIADYFFKDAFRFSIHEFAHYLLGGNNQHNGHAFWAMLSGYEVRSFMINAEERAKLGWGSIVDVNTSTQTLSGINLTDFLTTGLSYRIEINSATHQYFYMENHQRISRWDNCSNDESETGIYVIRQDKEKSSNNYPGPADWMWLIPANGRYYWTVNQLQTVTWFWHPLPVYLKGLADRTNGYSETDLIPFSYGGWTSPNEIFFIEVPTTGSSVDYLARIGHGKDAFRQGYNELFSPYSNPSSQKADRSSTGIGFKINSVNNGIVLVQRKKEFRVS